MKWQDEAIILKAKRHGETSWILSLMTLERGRYMGISRVSVKTTSLLQPGNRVQAQWSARLPDHLGSWQLELISTSFARLLSTPRKLNILTAVLSLLDHMLAERHPYPSIYHDLISLIEALETHQVDEKRSLILYCEFELRLLEQLGYGLDLSRCAVTGTTDDLTYVSPKTGRAVSQEAAQPYAPHLLRLPSFLRGFGEKTSLNLESISLSDVKNALYLTGYFLAKHFFTTGLPETRERLELMLGD